MNVIDPRGDDGYIPMYIKPHIEIHTYSNHTVPTNHEIEATSTKALWDIHLDYISARIEGSDIHNKQDNQP